jgi:hypothetical protein
VLKESQRKRNNRRQARRSPLPLIFGLGGLALLALAVFLLRPGGNEAGTPRLEVDRTMIDFGEQHFNEPVEAVFQITNTGDGTLRIEEEPVVEVREGC